MERLGLYLLRSFQLMCAFPVGAVLFMAKPGQTQTDSVVKNDKSIRSPLPVLSSLGRFECSRYKFGPKYKCGQRGTRSCPGTVSTSTVEQAIQGVSSRLALFSRRQTTEKGQEGSSPQTGIPDDPRQTRSSSPPHHTILGSKKCPPLGNKSLIR